MVEVSCPKCQSIFSITTEGELTPQFCVACGTSLLQDKSIQSSFAGATSDSTSAVTLVSGHLPKSEQIQFSIGQYQIIRPIGKGGMGEVFLAYDTSCGRRIALKRIRADLIEHQQMHNRFLKEARITSQLTHPGIIAIYEIHDERHLAYYTMPFVEGETLKQILKNARQREKQGEKSDHPMTGIPALIRIFLTVCQAVGYAHFKKVLHRDLKPENIIIGKYGESLILDWGLAKLTDKEHDTNEEGIANLKSHPLRALTNLGKVVGTVSYMAPERALGKPATYQTDIYSLGVILYQILTLRFPYHRKSLKEFRQNHQNEHLYEPALIAPHRDVPEILAQIAMKCMEKDPSLRYQSVDELLHHLESYIEGRPDWFISAELDIDNKNDWEFQENFLLAEHTAITRRPESSEWVSLMISKDSFDRNCKIEATVWLGEKSQGLGFLLCVPEVAERTHINDGYTLWIGSDQMPTTKLLRSTVEVFHASDSKLSRNRWHSIRIEKVENHIHFYLDEALQFSYLELIPMVGTHIGLLSRDGDYTIRDLRVSVGGHNITVNCLAVPDAFLAQKDYSTAISEYRRIGTSFPGRAEGREALFRSGITMLERAQHAPTIEERNNLHDQCFTEFEKLHHSAGAPLEYLGKALVYESIADYEEEVKCFDLAMRRYVKHPLLGVLKEQVIYRMHESSRSSRLGTYLFALLAVRQMPETLSSPRVKQLLNSVERHWETLMFIERETSIIDEQIKNLSLATILSFWLAKPHSLEEIFDIVLKMEPLSIVLLENIILCLLELGHHELASEAVEKLKAKGISPAPSILTALLSTKQPIEAFAATLAIPPRQLTRREEYLLQHLMEMAIDAEDSNSVKSLVGYSKCCQVSHEAELQFAYQEIWATLLAEEWDKAEVLLHCFPLEKLMDEGSLLHFLYGCWLFASEGSEIASLHFSSLLDSGSPRSWNLFGYYFNSKFPDEDEWLKKAFFWEKKQFYRQISLFYHCNGNKEKAST